MNTPRNAIVEALLDAEQEAYDDARDGRDPPFSRDEMRAIMEDKADRVITTLRERQHMLDQWHCRDGGPHKKPSPSQTPAAWCNDCGAVVPLHHFEPAPESYLIDGRK